MKLSAFGCFALTSCVAAATLAGCGGSQPPIGGSGAMPQTLASAAHAERGKSWMLPGTSSESLIYVATHDSSAIRIYSYPDGKSAGMLTIPTAPGGGECVDGAGDVFIPTEAVTYEYPHGGTSPIAQLKNPGSGFGCSYDPTTGSIAVSELDDVYNPYGTYGDVAVFAQGSQEPTMYYASGLAFWYCGYDDQGNLYLAAADETRKHPTKVQLIRLAKGSSTFEPISVNKPIYEDYFDGLWFPSVQWDGTYLTISTVRPLVGRHGNSPVTVYRLSVSGSHATVISETHLQSKTNKFKGQSWIEGSTILALDAYRNLYTSLWSYPGGGTPQRKINMGDNNATPVGVTVSAVAGR
jgi:hypothetical protein